VDPKALEQTIIKEVKDFPFYETRLKSIDHESIIKSANGPWEDETFPAE
jgi:hypothetical protein